MPLIDVLGDENIPMDYSKPVKTNFFKLRESTRKRINRIEEDKELNDRAVVPLETHVSLMKDYYKFLGEAERLQFLLNESRAVNEVSVKHLVQNEQYHKLVKQMAHILEVEIETKRPDIARALMKKADEIFRIK